MSLAENLKAANEVIKFVKKHLTKGASNKISDRLARAGGIEKVIASKQGMDYTLMAEVHDMRVGKIPGANIVQSLFNAGKAAMAAKCGNCGEQAAIAFFVLAEQGHLPVDYFVFGNKAMEGKKPAYDHAWVVLGRDEKSDEKKPRTWGKDAVWVDPWQSEEGMAYSIDDFVKGKVRNVNAIYKLNTVELVEAGLPQVYWRITA